MSDKRPPPCVWCGEPLLLDRLPESTSVTTGGDVATCRCGVRYSRSMVAAADPDYWSAIARREAHTVERHGSEVWVTRRFDDGETA